MFLWANGSFTCLSGSSAPGVQDPLSLNADSLPSWWIQISSSYLRLVHEFSFCVCNRNRNNSVLLPVLIWFSVFSPDWCCNCEPQSWIRYRKENCNQIWCYSDTLVSFKRRIKVWLRSKNRERIPWWLKILLTVSSSYIITECRLELLSLGSCRIKESKNSVKIDFPVQKSLFSSFII